MNCTICGTLIVLAPSAEERARKDVTGKSAAYYRSLFTAHDECQLIKRDHPEKLEAHVASVRATYKRSKLR
jgi:hypothetical protein